MQWLAILGSIFVGLAGLYYIVDILKGGSKPQRISWGVWSAIGLLGLYATIEGGAGAGSIVPAIYAAITATTFLLSLSRKYGKEGGEKYYLFLGTTAFVAALVWHFSGLSVAYAAALAVIADGLAAWPTIREAWKQPQTESTLAWSVSAIGATLGASSARRISFAALAYPVYLAVMITTVALVLIWRSRRFSSKGD